jgi:hypothetical protein
MTIKITLTDLVASLRKAASDPEAHAPAQRRYFTPLKPNSILVNCGRACCVAGDVMFKAYRGASERKMDEILSYWLYQVTPRQWVSRELGLTDLEVTLAFSANTHYRIHLLLADLLESGLRLHHFGEVEISRGSTYTNFEWASLGESDDKGVNLQELLEWMGLIAVPSSVLSRMVSPV